MRSLKGEGRGTGEGRGVHGQEAEGRDVGDSWGKGGRGGQTSTKCNHTHV